MIRSSMPLWAAVVVAAAYEPSARAQDEEATPPPAPSSPGPVQGPGFSRVIDREETIYTVQRKAYLLQGAWEISAMYNTLLGDRFVSTENSVGFGAGLGYHFNEAFAVEVFGGLFRPTESETTQELLDELNLETEKAKLTQLLWAAGAGVQWSPIYGKLQVAGTSLGNFAFYLGVGAALGQSRTACVPGGALDPNEFGQDRCEQPQDPEEVVYQPEELQVMAVLSGGFRFQFLEWLALRAEVRDYIFTSRVVGELNAPPYSDSVRNNIFFQVGLSFLLGGADN